MGEVTPETGWTNIGLILEKYSPDIRSLIRKQEKVCNKISKKKMSVVFNQTCINEGLLPKYTIFRLHDPAAKYHNTTTEFRKELIVRQITSAQNDINSLNEEFEKIKEMLKNKLSPEDLDYVQHNLQRTISNKEIHHRQQILKKLRNLYNGNILLPNYQDNYINLSEHILTNDQKEFLNLGPNCHLQSHFDPLKKKTEIEMLYRAVSKLQTQEIITVDPNLKDLLKAEGLKNRSPKHKSILTKELKAAAKELKNNPDIIIRRADKANMYVILNKIDYDDKIHQILKDTNKFKRLSKDTTDNLKKSVNALISANNAEIGSKKLTKITGEYKPGYLYGTVKIHKPGAPLRPIISQIPTPVYNISKTLNEIISPYIPSKYSVNSTDEFLEVLHTMQPNDDILASLDAENLFTNVPVEETINIICKNVFNHPSLPPPKIKSDTLRKLLLACTTQVPFVDHNGNLYTQINGVSMGSCLGPTFSEFYMSHIENKTFQTENKPRLYLRYVDDILILINNTDDIIRLRNAFQNNSVLTFTYELNKQNRIPFLDVLIDSSGDIFTTSPYRKPTSENSCLLNFKSECPNRYKIAVIKNFIYRAKTISSNDNIFFKALSNIKQTLINNNFPNHIVDQQIRITLKNHYGNNGNKQINKPSDAEKTITLFYCNQFHCNYKQDETTMKTLIRQHISAVDPTSEVKLIIYYRKFKTQNLLLDNNPSRNRSKVAQTNVIYEFICKIGNCISNNNSYVGQTTTLLLFLFLIRFV